MLHTVRFIKDTEETQGQGIAAPNDNLSLQQRGLGAMVEGFLDVYFAAHEGLMPGNGLYDRIIQEVERPLLRATLKLVNGNQKKAAMILGINRNTLRKKITHLQIDLAAL